MSPLSARQHISFLLTVAAVVLLPASIRAEEPKNNLASTGYCLAEVGAQYVVYQPAARSEFTVNLVAGDYHYEWIDPASGTVREMGIFVAPEGNRSFTPPLDGHAVLYVVRSTKN